MFLDRVPCWLPATYGAQLLSPIHTLKFDILTYAPHMVWIYCIAFTSYCRHPGNSYCQRVVLCKTNSPNSCSSSSLWLCPTSTSCLFGFAVQVSTNVMIVGSFHAIPSVSPPWQLTQQIKRVRIFILTHTVHSFYKLYSDLDMLHTCAVNEKMGKCSC